MNFRDQGFFRMHGNPVTSNYQRILRKPILALKASSAWAIMNKYKLLSAKQFTLTKHLNNLMLHQ